LGNNIYLIIEFLICQKSGIFDRSPSARLTIGGSKPPPYKSGVKAAKSVKKVLKKFLTFRKMDAKIVEPH
jgi:hypothetical protein